MIDYIPPEFVDFKDPQMVYFYTMEEKKPSYEIPFQNTQKKDLEKIKEQISLLFSEGFGWHELPFIMQYIYKKVDASKTTSPEEKQTQIYLALCLLANKYPTPWLPEDFQKALEGEMLPALISLLVSEEWKKNSYSHQKLGHPSEREILLFLEDTYRPLKSVLSWSDLASLIPACITFTEAYTELTPSQKAQIAKKIVDQLMTPTQTLILPDSFNEDVFKQFACAFIDQSFSIKGKHNL